MLQNIQTTAPPATYCCCFILCLQISRFCTHRVLENLIAITECNVGPEDSVNRDVKYRIQIPQKNHGQEYADKMYYGDKSDIY